MIEARTNLQAALVRALRTFLQTLIPALGAGAITDLDYVGGLSIAAGAALLSFLQGALRGLPESPDPYDDMDGWADPVEGEPGA